MFLGHRPYLCSGELQRRVPEENGEGTVREVGDGLLPVGYPTF